MPLPGIDVGEIGEKLGYNVIDNGFLSFNQVRIPRTDLLSRFVYVDKDGSFGIKGDPRMIYQTMVQTRLLIIQGSMYYLVISCRHATRYAVCRR
jgi:acyl-CoA oxidase